MINPKQQFIESLIIDAGKLTLNYFQQQYNIDRKSGNQGIVTEADFASEKLIKERILNTFPDHNILAEESGFKTTTDSSPYLWIIDPLDGTSNFSRSNNYYCISIAFGKLENNHFIPSLAAIYRPVTQDLFIAEKNKGCFWNRNKVIIPEIKDLKLSSVATGFSSNRGEELRPTLEAILELQNICLSVRINGAAALDLALVATGVFQGFYELPLAPWDMAAGILLIEEAGGIVTNYEGKTICPLQDRSIVAGNKIMHPILLRMAR